MAYSIFDRLLGLSNEPWLDRYKALRDKGNKSEQEGKKNSVSNAKPGTTTSHPLSDFAGDYANPGYGTLKIVQNGAALTLAINQMGPYPLSRLHYDIFQIPEGTDSPAAGLKAQFYMNRDGDIDRIAVPFVSSLAEDIVFTRAARKLPRETLEQLTGDYLLQSATVNVSLAGETLRLNVPDQPAYELVPTKELSFALKGLNGHAVEFKKDGTGKIARPYPTGRHEQRKEKIVGKRKLRSFRVRS